MHFVPGGEQDERPLVPGPANWPARPLQMLGLAGLLKAVSMSHNLLLEQEPLRFQVAWAKAEGARNKAKRGVGCIA